MLGTLAGCVNGFSGEIGVSGDGKTATGVIWWCDRPDVIHVDIGRYESKGWRSMVTFSSTAISGEMAELPIVRDRPGWKVDSGDPKALEGGNTYVISAWPGDGKNGSFGQTEFTVPQAMNLNRDQVKFGIPGSVISRTKFLTWHRSYCS
ncbi:hypothetical protein GCM10009530_62660 [Microbispora corallina]|nr:hypothetical protein [Microbispora corallina]